MDIKATKLARRMHTCLWSAGGDVLNRMRAILALEQRDGAPATDAVSDESQRTTVSDIVTACRGPVSAVLVLRSGASGVLVEGKLPELNRVGTGYFHCRRCCDALEIGSEEADEGEERSGFHIDWLGSLKSISYWDRCFVAATTHQMQPNKQTPDTSAPTNRIYYAGNPRPLYHPWGNIHHVDCRQGGELGVISRGLPIMNQGRQ